MSQIFRIGKGKVPNCPFCDCDDLELVPRPLRAVTMCCRCLAEGPEAGNIAEALRAWSERPSVLALDSQIRGLVERLTALCEILESDGEVVGCIGSDAPAEHEVGLARAAILACAAKR